MSVPTSCSNTQSKSVAKWYNCIINELVKKIILCRRQMVFYLSISLAALACVFGSVLA